MENNKDKSASLSESIGCLILLATLPLLYSIRAWAIIVLWGWFIEPAWHIATPSKASACGLSILLGMFTSQVSPKETVSIWVSLTELFLGPVFAVCFGWVVLWWFR